MKFEIHFELYFRLDGLDPMIAWAMGAATGHVAIALWKENELFLCESNALSAYW